MSNNLKPVTGEWYLHTDKGQSFRVLGVEREEDLIEIQHFDGDLEELGFGEWFALDLERAAQPEDWTGPIDDIEIDDLDSDTPMSEKDWRVSVDTNKRDEPPEDGGEEQGESPPADDGSDTEP